MVSSPEYEATTQPEAKMECDKDFLGEIIVKQIELNLIPKIFGPVGTTLSSFCDILRPAFLHL
jgi:hypothetical protein